MVESATGEASNCKAGSMECDKSDLNVNYASKSSTWVSGRARGIYMECTTHCNSWIWVLVKTSSCRNYFHGNLVLSLTLGPGKWKFVWFLGGGP